MRKVIMNSEIIKVLKELRAEQFKSGKKSDYVFGKHNKFSSVRKAWIRALKEAKIKDPRWHDFRHTGASYLAMSGVPLYAIKELGGWKSMEMVERYSHLSATYLRESSERLTGAFSEEKCTKSAQKPKNEVFPPFDRSSQGIID